MRWLGNIPADQAQTQTLSPFICTATMRHFSHSAVVLGCLLTVVSPIAIDSTIYDSGLEIDFLTEPQGCESPVKEGDIVTIQFEGEINTTIHAILIH